jgi:5'-nucleotidase
VRIFTDDIWVVAPDEEKSGFSHSISMTVPIRLRKIDDRHFAVKGTPTDCVLLAIYELMGDLRPTVVIYHGRDHALGHGQAPCSCHS